MIDPFLRLTPVNPVVEAMVPRMSQGDTVGDWSHLAEGIEAGLRSCASAAPGNCHPPPGRC